MKKYILYSFAFVFFATSMTAQNRQTKKGDKHYKRLEYVKAIKQYEKLVKKNKADAYVYKQLAKSYDGLRDAKNASEFYGKYLEAEKDADIDTEDYFRYAQMLKSSGDDEKSNQAMQDFAQKEPNDARAQAFNDNPNYLAELKDAERTHKVSQLEISSESQDFGGYELDDKLYFVSSRNKSRRTYGFNDQPTLDVYVAEREGGKYDNAKSVKGDVNTKFNQGPVTITEDGKTMYFSRNDYTNNKYGKSDDGIGQMKIYSAKKVDKEWGDVEELSFNSSEYSSRNPALSEDESALYFSSDRPGGQGGFDLYRVEIKEDGKFGEPENLGPEVNTPTNDDYPFVDSEGTLYFSSEGHLGMGGLDVFKAEKQGGSYGNVENMGADINTRGDDFAYTYYPDKKYGYVSSNRSGRADEDSKIDNDNIYQVLPVEQVDLYVKVLDIETDMPIEDATVDVYDEDKNKVTSKDSDDKGSAVFKELPGGEHQYSVTVNADDYKPKSANAKHQPEGKIDLVVELEPVEKKIKEKEIVLDEIYFEFDKAEITNEGALELDSLVAIMKKHEDMEIHVIAHTDNIGAEDYNQALSERRAQATVDYVVEQGIDENRIDGEGVGMSKPKIDCSECSDEERAENRRSEFKITAGKVKQK